MVLGQVACFLSSVHIDEVALLKVWLLGLTKGLQVTVGLLYGFRLVLGVGLRDVLLDLLSRLQVSCRRNRISLNKTIDNVSLPVLVLSIKLRALHRLVFLVIGLSVLGSSAHGAMAAGRHVLIRGS